MEDIQLNHYLWWLKKALDEQFKNREYKEIIQEKLNEDVVEELNELVSYIKINY